MTQLGDPTLLAYGNEAGHVKVKQEPESETPGKEVVPVIKPRRKLLEIIIRNLLSIAVLLSSLFFFLIANNPSNAHYSFFDVVNAARYHLCPYSPIKLPLLCPRDPHHPRCGPPKFTNGEGHCSSPWQDKSRVENAVFDRLLDEAAGGSALSSFMQEAQSVISDLAVDIQVSDFTQKDLLASKISKLSVDAGKTGKGLQGFSKKVDGTLDKVLTINRWALKTIEQAHTHESYEWLLQLVMPKRQTSQDVVAKTFGDTIDHLKNSLEKLVFEAERSDIDLQGVLNNMDVIRKILGQEKRYFANKHDQESAGIWHKLFGINQGSLSQNERNLKLLNGLGEQSKEGRNRIKTSLDILRDLSGELEVLQEKVTEAKILQMIPVREHISSIAEGVERLMQKRRIADKIQQEKIKTLLGQTTSTASPSTTASTS